MCATSLVAYSGRGRREKPYCNPLGAEWLLATYEGTVRTYSSVTLGLDAASRRASSSSKVVTMNLVEVTALGCLGEGGGHGVSPDRVEMPPAVRPTMRTEPWSRRSGPTAASRVVTTPVPTAQISETQRLSVAFHRD